MVWGGVSDFIDAGFGTFGDCISSDGDSSACTDVMAGLPVCSAS